MTLIMSITTIRVGDATGFRLPYTNGVRGTNAIPRTRHLKFFRIVKILNMEEGDCIKLFWSFRESITKHSEYFTPKDVGNVLDHLKLSYKCDHVFKTFKDTRNELYGPHISDKVIIHEHALGLRKKNIIYMRMLLQKKYTNLVNGIDKELMELDSISVSTHVI